MFVFYTAALGFKTLFNIFVFIDTVPMAKAYIDKYTHGLTEYKVFIKFS